MTASARGELVGQEENTVTICNHLWDQLKLFSALVFARSKRTKRKIKQRLMSVMATPENACLKSVHNYNYCFSSIFVNTVN